MKKIFSFAIACCMAVSAFATGHTVTIPTHTNVTCFGICNGTATASVSGGVGPFTYTWSPSGPSAATATNLCAGSYTVTVTDNSDASTATATVTITQPIQVVASIGGPMMTCMGSCIPLNGFASGGTPGYTYNWTPATGLSATTTANPVSCPPGSMTYTLVVTDASGCVGTTAATITVAPMMNITTSVVDATCGNCNGSATPTVIGGSPPYTYNWSDGSTAVTATNLCMGTYTVTAMDGIGCMGTAVAMVNSAASMTGLNSTVTNAACGNSDGAIAINSVTGGTSPYTYSWTPGGQTTQSITGLAAGVYNVTVTDTFGCTYSTPIAVNNDGGPTAVATTITSTACIGATGQVDIGAITGGVAPYTYSFNGGAYSGLTTYGGLAMGTYVLAVKDVNGCIFNTSATVGLNNPPVITLNSLVNAACTGGGYGNISVSLSSGTPPYSYAWSNGDTSLTIDSLIGANYTLSVTDAAGCTASQLYHVSNSVVIYANIISTPANCGTLGTATVSTYSGMAPFSYLWNTVPAQTTATATGLAGGSYYNCMVTDANGCSTTVYTWISTSCYNVIKGNIYNDANSNCIKEVGETGIAGRQVVATPGYYYGYTAANGDYTILTPNMSNTVYYGTTGVGTFLSPTCPATGSMTVNFSTPGDTSSNNNFGLYADPSYVNLVIHPGWSSANPGFQKRYWICYYNGSPTPQNATIRFVYDSLLQFTSCTMGGVHDSATHSIVWNYTALPSATIWNWATKPEIFFNVPTTLSTSTILHSYFEITPIAGDAYPPDNTLLSDEPVTGSHDPNSKAVMPAGDGPNGDILVSDSTLLYTIHFQNNGNDTAHFVIVKDTLSSFLDPLTIVPGAASHPYTFELSEQGILTFTFNDIMLPDSTTDEPGSNGYFNYTVRQRAGNPVGTVINNTAGIYFDYNLPVITNTTINTIVDLTTGIETASTNNVVKVFPNPFTDNTTFVIQSEDLNEVYTFEMTDVLGKTVKAMNNISDKQFNISRDGLQTGIYFYKVYSNSGVVGIGKLIIK